MKKQNQVRQQAFTLVELLVVIGIIAVLIGFAMANFLGARERARDARLKHELAEIKNALRLYYNDYNRYPAGGDSANPQGGGNRLYGCGTNGDEMCPVCPTADFAAGGADGCETVYMKKFPYDLAIEDTQGLYFTNSFNYFRTSDSDDFCMKVPLNNESDPDLVDSQNKCSSSFVSCNQLCSGTNFCVCGF